MPAPAAIAFLQAAVLALRGASDPDVIAGRQATAAWLDGRAPVSLDEALGVKPTAGQRTQRTLMALRRRDDFYREMAAACFPTDTKRGRAASMHAALSDYAGRAWIRERAHPCRHREGSLPFFMWHVMRAHAEASNVVRPLSAVAIARLLDLPGDDPRPRNELGG